MSRSGSRQIPGPIFIRDTEIIYGEVKVDIQNQKTELGCFEWKMKVLPISHKLVYFDLEQRNNQSGGFR